MTTQTKMENWGGPPEMAGVLGTLAPSAQHALFGLAVTFRDMERDHAERVAALEEERRREIDALVAEKAGLTALNGDLQGRSAGSARKPASRWS